METKEVYVKRTGKNLYQVLEKSYPPVDGRLRWEEKPDGWTKEELEKALGRKIRLRIGGIQNFCRQIGIDKWCINKNEKI